MTFDLVCLKGVRECAIAIIEHDIAIRPGCVTSLFADFTCTKITTLMTSWGSSTFAVIFDLFGLQTPQKILLSEIWTETNPGPGLMGVGDITGVAVSLPIKMGIGTKVAVGRFGSTVGKWTIVGDGVMVGVMVAVGVMDGINVTVAVAVGAAVLVGGNNTPWKGMPEHACKNIINARTGEYLRIRYLVYMITVRTKFSLHFTTSWHQLAKLHLSFRQFQILCGSGGINSTISAQKGFGGKIFLV
jgi:hypothetical protein